MKRIPLVPFEPDTARRFARPLRGLGESLSHMFPSLGQDIEQAGMEIEPRDWTSIAAFTAIFYLIVIFGVMMIITTSARIEAPRAVGTSFLAAGAIGAASFFYINMYPKLIGKKKVRDVDKNLPYALHHLLVQIRSGVPLFNCLVSVSKGDYGELSRNIERVIDEVNTGKSEIEALEALARKNTSLYLRRVLWQVVNSLKSGADIGMTIKEIVDDLSVNQTIAIKKYGAQLNPVALMYMVFCVIMPTLGITFLLVLSSFIGLPIPIEYMLMGILGFLLMFQFMLIGMIKSKRPIGI